MAEISITADLLCHFSFVCAKIVLTALNLIIMLKVIFCHTACVLFSGWKIIHNGRFYIQYFNFLYCHRQDSFSHSTDLKNRILANFTGLQADKQGRYVLLAFNEDIGNALKIVSERDCDDEAVILSKVAKIV